MVLEEPAGAVEGVAAQMNIAAKIRARRTQARNRRAVNRALATAATPAMRDEILIMAQRQQGLR